MECGAAVGDGLPGGCLAGEQGQCGSMVPWRRQVHTWEGGACILSLSLTRQTGIMSSRENLSLNRSCCDNEGIFLMQIATPVLLFP